MERTSKYENYKDVEVKGYIVRGLIQEEYKQTRLEIVCNKCGKMTDVDAYSFIKTNKTPRCGCKTSEEIKIEREYFKKGNDHKINKIIDFTCKDIIGEIRGTDKLISYVGIKPYGANIVSVECNICGENREVDGNDFLNSRKRLTQCACQRGINYNKYVGEVYGTDKVIRQEGYVGNHQKAVVVECILCGKERKVAGSAVISENRNRNMEQCNCKTNRYDYSKLVGNVYGTDKIIKVLEEPRTRENLQVECVECGCKREVVGTNLVQGKRVKLCECMRKGKIHERHDYDSLVGEVVAEDKVLEVIREGRSRHMLKVECEKCSLTREVVASSFDNGDKNVRCHCESEEYYYKRLIGTNIKGNKVLGVLRKYRGDWLKLMLKVRCISCGRVRKVTASALVNNTEYNIKKCDCQKNVYYYNKGKYIGRTYGALTIRDIILKDRRSVGVCDCRCGKQNIEVGVSFLVAGSTKSCGCIGYSLGEAVIGDKLDELKLDYNKEQTFNGLVGVGGGPLRYDFSVIKSKEIICLVEYDGLHHIDVNKQIYVKTPDEAKESFEKVKKHDDIKNKYAYTNRIPLLRIPYSRVHTDIEEGLEKFLRELNII